MRRRRPLKNTSFKPTSKFKVKINPAPLKPNPLSPTPAFESPLFLESQSLPFQPQPTLFPLGIVTHYYDKIKVAVLKLSAPLKKGTKVQWMGEKGVFTQKINSMQIDRQPVEQAPKGADIGIKVKRKVVLGEIAYEVNS